jgi:hypothetical protein
MMLLLLLALLPLDLKAPGANEGASLGVKLELMASDRWGATYRITHTFRGAQPMRFVTGATDKNCDEPVDQMIVDGKPVALWSNLPCGGFAFRATRKVKPGEAWRIEGTISLAAGHHTVAARYCPTSESLRVIDPNERKVTDPPWWLGCVDSPPVGIDIPK